MSQKNKHSRPNRAQIEWMQVLDPHRYLLIDYLMFRSNSKTPWKFHISQVHQKTQLSRSFISRAFDEYEFVTKHGEGQSSYFLFDHQACLDKCNALYAKLKNNPSAAGNYDVLSDSNKPASGSNDVVAGRNDVASDSNRVVAVEVPTSIKEVEKKVVVDEVTEQIGKQVEAKTLKQSLQLSIEKTSEEYAKLQAEIQDCITFGRVFALEALIIQNEQWLRENKDYDLRKIHLEQCKRDLLEREKRKNSVLNKHLK